MYEILYFFWALDILFTYSWLKYYSIKHPKDYYHYEGNYVLRFLFKKLGVDKGMFLGVIFTFVLISLAYVMTQIDSRTFYILIGIYFVTFMGHFNAFESIYRERKKSSS